MVRTLLDEGARVVAVSRKSTPELDAAAGPDLLHVAADLMDPEAMMNLVTGRLADPREVADVIALLVSPRSASITGAEYVVDGGRLKRL